MKLKLFITASALVCVIGAFIFISLKGGPLGIRENAGLQVITDPAGSSIFLDGIYLEKSPLIERELAPGQYHVRIEPDDNSLVPYETTVTLSNGALTVLTWKPAKSIEESGGVLYEMQPLEQPDSTQIIFTSVPEGAIVAAGDRERTFTPTVFDDFAPGNIEYELTLPSYETQRHTLSLKPGFSVKVSAKLAKLEPVSDDE